MTSRQPSRARPILVSLGAIGVLTAGGHGTARAQDTTRSERAFLLEGRVGVTEALGAGSRYLVGPDGAAGVTFAFQLSGYQWGWVSADYKPWNSSVLYPGSGMAPGIGLYTLTAGVSRTFGVPFARMRWRPFEIGLGLGATKVDLQSNAHSDLEGIPADAEFESVFDSELMSTSPWRPSAAARLRIGAPLFRAVRVSATAGLIATHVGDVRLWNGRWEPTGEGSRYRPSSEVWSFGTIVTVPLTVGLGFRF